MWADFLSMAAIAVFAACLVFIVRRSLRRKGIEPPRWIMPAVIGASMIGYSIWNEYTWFDRMTSRLPDTIAVVGQGERSAFWAPWTHLYPVTVRFVAVDTHNRLRSEERPDLVVTEILLIERWQPTRKVSVAFDCSHARRADLHGAARIEPDGTLEGAEWQAMDPASPMLVTACQPERRT